LALSGRLGLLVAISLRMVTRHLTSATGSHESLSHTRHGVDGLESENDRGDSTLRATGSTTRGEPEGRIDVISADDPRKAWQYMIEQLQKAWPGPNAPEFLQTMFSPMQQQLDLLRKASEAQAEFYRKLTEQMFAPMRQMVDGLQQAVKTTRAAGEALKQAGDLLLQQAAAMDQALSFTGPILEMTAPPSEGSAKTE
jgi:hypothetical protein